MKFFFIFCLITLIAASCFCACDNGGDPPQNDEGKPVVYASFYPMYDFASKIAGDAANIKLLVPDGTEPHDWEPSPKDIVGLENADLFFYSGAGFESWVEPVLPKIKNEKLVVVETSANIEKITSGEDGHGHGESDPHMWLSPQNAKQQMRAMCDAFKQVDPQNAEHYEQNLQKYSAELDKLDEEYGALRSAKQNMIVVTHAAFGYLCDEYGLIQQSVTGYSPEGEPNPQSMVKIINIARENSITTVFYESNGSKKQAEAIAKEIGAKTELLNPIEGLSGEQRKNGEDYFSIMRQNLAVLREALL